MSFIIVIRGNMMTSLYPSEIELNIQLLDLKKITEELSIAKSPINLSYCGKFLDLSREAQENHQYSQMKMYYLLAYVSSFDFDTDSKNFQISNSFYEVWDSELLKGFTEKELLFFTDSIYSIENLYLKGRLADVLWSYQQPKNIDYPKLVIEQYISVPLNCDEWSYDGSKMWERAISLTLCLGRGAQQYFTEIENLFESYLLEPASVEDGLILTWIFSVLEKFNIARKHYGLLASKLVQIATLEFQQGNFFVASSFFRYASKCYLKLSRQEIAYSIIMHEARCHEEEAEDRNGSMMKKHFCELAYKTLLEIPRKYREIRKVDKKINELRRNIDEFGSSTIGEMHSIATHPVDLSELILKTHSQISGKQGIVAFNIFFNSIKINLDDLLQSAQECLDKSVFSKLVSSVYIANNGHTVVSNIDFQNALGIDTDLYHQLLKNYDISILIKVYGHILPSLEILHQEHCFSLAEVSHIVHNARIVPSGREQFIIEGILAGYQGNYAVALHLLVPQVENIVRIELKKLNVSTSTIGTDGEETENGLSTLLALPEADKLGDKSFVFELRTLLCEHTHANFRNNVAHGLLNYEECNSVVGVYTWWFISKMIFNSFLCKEEK